MNRLRVRRNKEVSGSGDLVENRYRFTQKKKIRHYSGTQRYVLIVSCFLVASILSACTRASTSESPWSLSQQSFVEQGFSPQVGDQVWVRVFDQEGQELIFEIYDIKATNLGTWQDDLTTVLNEGKANQYMQVRFDPGKKIAASTNYVWLKNPEHSYVMGLRH